MSATDPKLSPLGERVVANLKGPRLGDAPSPLVTVAVGCCLVGIAWGWRAALGAGGVYLLALAWKWVTG